MNQPWGPVQTVGLVVCVVLLVSAAALSFAHGQVGAGIIDIGLLAILGVLAFRRYSSRS